MKVRERQTDRQTDREKETFNINPQDYFRGQLIDDECLKESALKNTPRKEEGTEEEEKEEGQTENQQKTIRGRDRQADKERQRQA